VPWRKPWAHGGLPGEPKRADGQPFSGFNAWTLAMFAGVHGYAHASWLTYRQAEALGGQVRRGEKASPAILYKTKVTSGQAADPEAATGDQDGRVLRFLKSYGVFNAAQVDGLPASFYTDTRPERRDVSQLPPELAAVPATVIYDGSDPAFYPSHDHIRMPLPGDFESPAAWHAIAGHELVHWTAGPGRLERGLERYHVDPTARALEELTAELGTILLAMRLGLPLSEHLMQNHAAYISSWARLLTDTPSALMKASGQAQKAVEYLLAFSQPLGAERSAEAA
ncbi:MAG: hypothetical protein B7Z26_11475, partial [Asticcacaulis sp. 32-58-5]